MYICICNAITDQRISEVISSGHDEPDSVYAACGVSPKCGLCAETIEEMIFCQRRTCRIPAAAE